MHSLSTRPCIGDEMKRVTATFKSQMKTLFSSLKLVTYPLSPGNMHSNQWVCRSNSLLLPVVFILVFLLNPQVTTATDYFVAKTGKDTNPGTQLLPWKTISRAADYLVAGDTVYIGPGTYSERLIPANSGINGQYISFTAQAGASVIIDGTAITLPDYDSGLVDIEGRSHIRVSGLNVRNAGPYQNNSGIYINTSSNIIIENNDIYNTVSSGIGVWNSTNIVLDRNEVQLACNDGEQECITIAGTNGFEVKNNHVHHNGPGTNGGEGIDAKDGSRNGTIHNNLVHDLNRLGIYVEAWDKHTYNIEVFKNKIYNCQNDGITLASEQGGLLENISITNNLIYDNYNGISITPNGDVASPPMRNLSVVNNTIHKNGGKSPSNQWGGGIVVDNPNINTLVIRNNIFSQNYTFQILIDTQVSALSVDHNLVYGFRYYDNEVKGISSVSGDPLFINKTSGDFHLQASSPAIDKGHSLMAPSDDYDSVKRPQGMYYDIGAYEYSLQGSLPGTLLMLLDK